MKESFLSASSSAFAPSFADVTCLTPFPLLRRLLRWAHPISSHADPFLSSPSMFVCLLLSHSLPLSSGELFRFPSAFQDIFCPKFKVLSASLSLLLRLSGPSHPRQTGWKKRGTVAGFYYLTTRKRPRDSGESRIHGRGKKPTVLLLPIPPYSLRT